MTMKKSLYTVALLGFISAPTFCGMTIIDCHGNKCDLVKQYISPYDGEVKFEVHKGFDKSGNPLVFRVDYTEPLDPEIITQDFKSKDNSGNTHIIEIGEKIDSLGNTIYFAKLQSSTEKNQ